MKKKDATILDMMIALSLIILSNIVFWGCIAYIVYCFCKHS